MVSSRRTGFQPVRLYDRARVTPRVIPRPSFLVAATDLPALAEVEPHGLAVRLNRPVPRRIGLVHLISRQASRSVKVLPLFRRSPENGLRVAIENRLDHLVERHARAWGWHGAFRSGLGMTAGHGCRG